MFLIFSIFKLIPRRLIVSHVHCVRCTSNMNKRVSKYFNYFSEFWIEKSVKSVFRVETITTCTASCWTWAVSTRTSDRRLWPWRTRSRCTRSAIAVRNETFLTGPIRPSEETRKNVFLSQNERVYSSV